jgi:CRAL/TRIO domain
MFYMRPSRYVPKEMSTKSVIDNLAYVIHSMMERSCHADAHGIGFIACMDDWTMNNFDVDYCLHFMMMLQGHVIPVKVQLFLIVNPPSWFDAAWKIMKTMLTPSFRSKVKMIPQHDLPKYLQDGYLTYLPDDMEGGQANTEDLVRDFVSYQCYKDEQNPDWDNGVSTYSEMFNLSKSSSNHQQHQQSYRRESSSDGSSFGDNVDDITRPLPKRMGSFALRRNDQE